MDSASRHTRREFLKMGAGGALALLGATTCGSALLGDEKLLRRPNVVYINVDDFDFDELGAYDNHPDPSLHGLPSYTGAAERGFPHAANNRTELAYTPAIRPGRTMYTPNIDRFALQGVTFSRFYITTAICTPSRYSLLTGLYASHSKSLRKDTPEGESPIIEFNTLLDGSEMTIAHALKQGGYTTGMVGKWHNGGLHFGNLSDADPHDPAVAKQLRARYDEIRTEIKRLSGFDYVEAVTPGNIQGIGVPKELWKTDHAAGIDRVHNLEWQVEAAVNFLEQNKSNPFFLYFATTVPHGWMPFMSGCDDDARYTPAGILDESPASGMPSRSLIKKRSQKAGHGRAGALWLDEAFGVILKKLSELGLDDNTVVVFASDNGNRGKQAVYEGCRVPCILRWPGVVKPGSVSHSLVANIDFAATIMDICGVRRPVGMSTDGKSIVPILKGKSARVRESLLLEVGCQRAVVTEDLKYVAVRPPKEIAEKVREESSLPQEQRKYDWSGSWNRRKWNGWRWGTPTSIVYDNNVLFPAYFELDQLYDMQKDPYEQKNLINDPKYSAKLPRLKRLLAKHIEETDQAFGEFSRVPAKVARP